MAAASKEYAAAQCALKAVRSKGAPFLAVAELHCRRCPADSPSPCVSLPDQPAASGPAALCLVFFRRKLVSLPYAAKGD